jgi:hypothetical protein
MGEGVAARPGRRAQRNGERILHVLGEDEFEFLAGALRDVFKVPCDCGRAISRCSILGHCARQAFVLDATDRQHPSAQAAAPPGHRDIAAAA